MSTTKTTTRKLVANPFPGLRPFHIEESHLFFGREGQTDEVLMKLSENRFAGVIGPSGSGKSSFVYCGVLPILYGGFLTNTGPNWEVIVSRPGNNPIRNLGEAILTHDPTYAVADPDDQRIKRTIMATLMKSSSLGLVEAIKQTRRSTGNNYLVLIDQFEELFRFKENRSNSNALNETLSFINLLMEAINYSELPIYVAITMRSDFIGECAQFAELTRKINDSHYLIPQLTREQKRRAIEGPVAVGGGEVEPRLVQRLLNDLGDNPDQLPILQHSLMRTWDYWSKNREGDEVMDLKHYEAIGTMSEALSLHANEAYDELSEDQREVCAVMFKAITEKRGENFGIRRPTVLSEIAAIADVSVEEVAAIIEKFREPGRSLLIPPHGKPLEPDSMIDISHESLMRIWVRLKNWVDEEAESINMYLRLSEASAMHQVGKGGLWRPPDLQLALNWQIKHKPTLVWGQRYDPAFERAMVFLEYSKKAFEEEQKIKELQAKRALQRMRITAIVMGSATVVSLIFLIFAFAQKILADKNAEEAKKQAAIAQIQRKAADSSANVANIQADRANKNADTALMQKTRADSNARQARIAQDSALSAAQRARAAELLAKENETLAKKNEAEATRQRDRAQEQERIATINKAKADTLRFMSLSKALAITSAKPIPDNQLKGLLAMQAYNFNKQYAGPEFNADIYAGLYDALKQFTDNMTQSLAGHEQQVTVVISGVGGGQFLFSADSKGKILRWSIAEGQTKADTIASARPFHVIKDMKISPDGEWLVSAGDFPLTENGSVVNLYNLKGSGTQQIGGFKGIIKKLAFYPDRNKFFALQDGGKELVLCDLADQSVTPFLTPKTKLNSIFMHPKGQYLAGAGVNGKLYTWDLENNNSEDVIVENKVALTSVAFSHNGEYLAAGDQEGGVKLVLFRTKTTLRSFSEITAGVTDITFSNDGRYLAVSSRDKKMRVWNLKNLKDQPLVLSDYQDWVSSLAFTPDSQFLLGGGFGNGEVRVWPMDIKAMAGRMCGHITRTLNKTEWEIYVANVEDIPIQNTCQ